MNLNSNTKIHYALDCGFLLILLGCLYFVLLGSRPLFVPDEGRYAEIGREMLVTGDFITPYLNSIKYFEKPVLYYWLTALAFKLFGLSLWVVRSVNAFLSLIVCLATYFTVNRVFNRWTGLVATLILGTSFLYTVMTRMVTLDLPVTAFITLSLYAFLLGVTQQSERDRRLFYWASAASAGFAVLTKGLIGILFPSMIIASWLIIHKKSCGIKQNFFSSLLVFLIVVLPWHVLVQWQNPEFFNFYVIEQHFLRYLEKEVGHYQPFWFFIPCLLLGFFPWVVFLPQAIMHCWKQAKHKGIELFLLLWAGLIFLFFSFSKSKLIPYILPVFPPLAIITALYIAKIKFFPKMAYCISCLFAVGLAIFLRIYLSTHAFPNPEGAFFSLTTASLIAVCGSLLALLMGYKRPKLAVIIVAIYSSLFSLMVFVALPNIDHRTIYPLAKVLQTHIQPDDIVVSFNRYYQDLPFYLQRKISIVNWRNELSFGMQHQTHHDWMINEHDFWQLWTGRKRVFVIMGKDDFQKILASRPGQKFELISQTHNNILAANRRLNN